MLPFCFGFTPFLGLESKKRLALDLGAKARHRSFRESERFSNAGKMCECDEPLDWGVEGCLDGAVGSGGRYACSQ
jgi:hypothetical protein